MKNYKTLDEFIKACDEITVQVKKIDPNAIIDGVINPEKYFNLPKEKPRVLWILKEANSLDLAWSYQYLLSASTLTSRTELLSIRSIYRVICASYSILNNFQPSSGIISQKREKKIYSETEQIAFININKRSGGLSSVGDGKMYKSYEIFRDIIKKQIEVYNPDIIIFGNTKKFFNKLDLDFNDDTKKYADETTYNTAYYQTDKRLYINAYHPAYFRLNDEKYCSEIISVAKNWWKNKKK